MLYKKVSALDGQVVPLIDAEGAEARVLRGGREFLRRCAPLINFEYNSTSGRHFSLDDIRDVLGERYDMYRLTAAGRHDRDFDRSWNCVAVSVNSAFWPVCEGLLNR